jgi:hypothetical protein
MKRPVVTLVTLAGVGLFVACGFPDLSYTDGVAGEGGTDSSVDGLQSAETSPGDEASDDGTTTGPDGPESSVDASGDGDAAGLFDSETSTAADEGAGDGSDSSSPADGASSDGAPVDAPGDGPVDASTDAADSAPGDGAADGPHDAGPDVVDAQPVDSGPVCDNDGDHDLAKGSVCGGTDCDDDDARAYYGEPDYLTFAPTPVTKGDWNCDGVVETQFTTSFSCGLFGSSSCGTQAGFADTPGCGATSTQFTTCKVAGIFCVTDTTTSNTQGCK